MPPFSSVKWDCGSCLVTLAVVTGGRWSQGKDALAVFLTHAFLLSSVTAHRTSSWGCLSDGRGGRGRELQKRQEGRMGTKAGKPSRGEQESQCPGC